MGKGPYEETKSEGKRSFRVPRASDSEETPKEKQTPVLSVEMTEAEMQSSSFDEKTEIIATDIFEHFPSQFEGGYLEEEEPSFDDLLKDVTTSPKFSVPTFSEEEVAPTKPPAKKTQPEAVKKSMPGVSPYIKPPQQMSTGTHALLSRFHEVMKTTGEISDDLGTSFPGDDYVYEDENYGYDEEYDDEYEDEGEGFWSRFRAKRAQKKEEKRLRKEEDYEYEDDDYEEDTEFYEEEIYDRSDVLHEKESLLDGERIEEQVVLNPEPDDQSITFETQAQSTPPLLSAQKFKPHDISKSIERNVPQDREDGQNGNARQTATGNIRRIHAIGGEDEETPLHPESLIIERPDDYRSVRQKKEKAAWLDNKISSYTGKVGLLILLSLFFIYVSFSSNYTMPLPSYVDPLTEPFHYLVFNLILVGLSIFIVLPDFLEALKGFFTLNPTKSSLLAIATVFTALQLLFYFPQANQIIGDGIQLYAPVAVVGWLFHMIGNMLDAARIRTNFGVVSSEKTKYRVAPMPDSNFMDAVIHSTNNPDEQTMAPVESAFLQRYIELSDPKENTEEAEDPFNRWLPYISFAAALLVSFFAWLLLSSLTTATTLFVGTLLVAATFSAVFQNAYPQYRASRYLAPKGAFISGLDALEQCAETSSVVIDASSLFPKGSIVLQGLRTFEGGRIDEAIVDAASVMNAMGGTLADLFFSIIEYRKEILNPVESILYEEGRGIVAWSEGRRVLIGNRQLMRQYGIDTPSNDYESKYRVGGRDLIYIASSGVLTAMYVVLYKGEHRVRHALQSLTSENVTILLRSVDPNVTAEKVIELFDLPDDSVILLTDREVRDLSEITEPQLRADADAGFTDRFLGYLGVVNLSIRFFTTLTVTRLMELIGILFGFIMLVSAAFFSQMVGITPFLLIVYNAAWFVLIWFMGKFRKL